MATISAQCMGCQQRHGVGTLHGSKSVHLQLWRLNGHHHGTVFGPDSSSSCLYCMLSLMDPAQWLQHICMTTHLHML